MKSLYIRTKLNNFINITEIVTVHSYEFDRSFKFDGETHNFWEMVYVNNGSVEITREEETLILKQGEVIFHSPNEFHAIKSHNSSPDFFVVSFVCKSATMRYFDKLSLKIDQSLKPFVFSIASEAEKMYSIPKNNPNLKKLTPKADAPIGGEQLIKTYLEQFLILIARKIFEKKDVSIFPSKDNMETYLVSEIKKFLDSKVTERVHIEEICDTFGYSKTYLSELFKSQCSMSIISYFNKQKIEYAKKLIRENKMNITEVSNALSFDNPQYFSRVFKKFAGVSPREFTNSLKFQK